MFLKFQIGYLISGEIKFSEEIVNIDSIKRVREYKYKHAKVDSEKVQSMIILNSNEQLMSCLSINEIYDLLEEMRMRNNK